MFLKRRCKCYYHQSLRDAVQKISDLLPTPALTKMHYMLFTVASN